MEESNEKQNKRTASADPLKTYLDSTQEFFDMWMNNYQSTFGKLAQIPAFGPIREKQEKMMKGFPVYVNLYNTWVESNINFQTVFTGAMRKTYEKMIKESNGEITTEKYKDFYKIWLETYSDTLKEFMKSGHFASDMGKLMTHFMDFQKYNKEMIEENLLKPNNIPTKTEIDEINKELYFLKKTIKDLSNNIDKKIEEQKVEIQSDVDKKIEKIDEVSKKIDEQKVEIQSDLETKITQSDLDKKIGEMSKKTKLEIQANLEKRINEVSKKIDEQKVEIKSDLNKKITQTDLEKKIDEVSKKTKLEIQANLDKKIDEVYKKIDEQKSVP